MLSIKKFAQATTSQNNKLKFLFLIPMVPWLVGTMLPAFIEQNGEGTVWTGGTSFMTGAMFCWMPIHPGIIAWWANIAMVWSWLECFKIRNKKTALILAGLAIGLSCIPFFVDQMPFGIEGKPINVTLGPAVYFWVGAMVVNFFVTLYVSRKVVRTPVVEVS